VSAARIPADWPHQASSQLVEAGGLTWHVQRFGAGPIVLLIHGTAASTHSFRRLADLLSGEFEIVMADLPGHGYSGPLDAPSLPRVSRALGALLTRLEAAPVIAAGHSAGAAIAIRMTLDGLIAPDALVGLAPALKPYGGSAGGLASWLAQLAFLNPLTPRLFAGLASQTRVAKLIAKTGSRLDEEGIAYYARLLERPAHISGALRLMAHWDLRPLVNDLNRLTTPLTLAVGDQDYATPLRDAEAAAKRVPPARVIPLPGLGHLAHEEDPAGAAELIRDAARVAGPDRSMSEAEPILAGGRS